MAARREVLLLLSVMMISLFAGCGGGTATTVQNAPAPVGLTVAIAFDPTPPGSVFVNATTAVTAVVSNDASNAGVDWSLTCQGNGCGSLTPLHTASGEAATYTPPSNLPGNSQTVNIVAFATTDHSRNVVTPLTVTAFGSNLKGTYVLQTSGVDDFGAYQYAGVVVLDGNGGITSGEQTYSNSVRSVSDPITGGSYYIGPDGRGTLTINTANQNLGQQGIETFSLVFLSSSRAFIAKTDDPNSQVTSDESSAGILELQTSTAAPTGGYAFVVSGTDIFLSPMAFGGVLNIDSPKTISGAGSVADQDLAGGVNHNATVSGTVSDPDSFGAVKFNLAASFATVPIEFTGYVVDAMHIKLIESDNDGSGNGFGSTAGVAIGQGAATGTFTDNSAFSGTYVFGIFGEDLSGLPSSLSAAGTFVADGNGNLTQGFCDEFLGGLFFSVHDRFNGIYSVDSSGTGRADSLIKFHHPINLGLEFIFYLTGNGNPPLFLDADVNIGSLGAGIAYPQAAPPLSFSGTYGVSLTQSSFGSEVDSTSQITVDGNTNTLSGVMDANFFFSPAPDTPLTGTFDAISTTGRSDGELSNQLFFLPTISVAYYLIDSGQGLFVETDSLSTGELSFGYFAARTPVCQGCP